MRKTILITGGAHRLGKVIADTLTQEGYEVLVHSRNNANSLRVDFREENAAEQLIKEATSLAPNLFAIINNASIFSPKKELTKEDADAMQKVNYLVPKELTKSFYEYLKSRNQNGIVINILDSRILSKFEETPYALSKYQLMRETQSSALHFAPTLRVLGIAPGSIIPPPKEVTEKAQLSPLPRPTPEDVAKAVLFFIETPSVTGEILAIDSGASLLARSEV